MSALAHKVAWQAPRPLWRGAQPYARAPQLLRFASDDFMDQLLATLAEEPARISDRIARFETWRDPPRPSDLTDPIVRVPLPAPMKAAKRGRLLRAPVTPPPASTAGRRLKLYQPAQQRYYVVAGTLACAIPGLPERSLAGGHETVHFVMRRLMPAAGEGEKAEYAFVRQGVEARWQKLAAGTDLAPGEELLPLFPLQHRDEEGRPRTLWGGLVPVGRREQYLAQPVVTTPVPLFQGQADTLKPPPAPAPANSTYARTARLRMEVSEPWKGLVRAAVKAGLTAAAAEGETEPAGKKAERLFRLNLQYQMQSWLLLLDLRQWIKDELPLLDAALASPSLTPPATGTTARAAWDMLAGAKADDLEPAMRDPDPLNPDPVLKPMATSMIDALARIAAFGPALEAMTTHYTAGVARAGGAGWPDFHFPLAGLTSSGAAGGPWLAIVPPAPQAPDAGTTLNPPGTTAADNAKIEQPKDFALGGANQPDPEQLDRFTAVLARALPVKPETDAQPIPHAMKLRDVMLKTAGDGGLFVIRMVHVNADCGPLHPPTLSEPSERFELASFFDPEAPVRPITITLPSDTSPAGLRKHGRGAAFVMSDMLCGQVQRAKGLGFIDLVLQVLPWPFHKDIDVGDGGGCKGNGAEIGMICSLSIPIITLCALILLIIIVTLLDFIFRWLPWFICCFPVPKLKGKPA